MGFQIDLGPLGEQISATPNQTCKALSIGVTKLYQLLNARELASYHEGKARRILVSSIRDYLTRRIAQSSKAAPPQPAPEGEPQHEPIAALPGG